MFVYTENNIIMRIINLDKYKGVAIIREYQDYYCVSAEENDGEFTVFLGAYETEEEANEITLKMFAAMAKGSKTYYMPLSTAEKNEELEDPENENNIEETLADNIRTKLEIRGSEMTITDIHRLMPPYVEKSKVSEAIDYLLETKVVDLEGDIVRLR